MVKLEPSANLILATTLHGTFLLSEIHWIKTEPAASNLKSQFQVEKCETVACTASPVGDSVEATTLPLPSSTQRPLLSSKCHIGISVPTFIS